MSCSLCILLLVRATWLISGLGNCQPWCYREHSVQLRTSPWARAQGPLGRVPRGGSSWVGGSPFTFQGVALPPSTVAVSTHPRPRPHCGCGSRSSTPILASLGSVPLKFLPERGVKCHLTVVFCAFLWLLMRWSIFSYVYWPLKILFLIFSFSFLQKYFKDMLWDEDERTHSPSVPPPSSDNHVKNLRR